MWRFILSVLFAFLVCIFSPRASAAPQVTISPRFLSEGYYSPQFKDCDGETEDALTLTVSDHGKPVVSKNFCSSYGRASARVIVNKFGETIIVLKFSEGRGSNAWTDFLELDQLQQPRLLEVLRVPLSWATSGTGRFTYNYVVELTDSGGIRIHLNGQNERSSQDNTGLCCMPQQSDLTIDVP
jgi:hypothetical protein